MAEPETLPVKSPPLSPAQRFHQTAQAIAERTLAQILGSEEGKKKAAQFAVAFRAAAAAARDPGAIYGCSPESVASALVNSILTDIMPGGAAPGCYLVPKGGHIQWWITHRGILELARRAGQTVQVRAIFPGDSLDLYEDENGVRFRFEGRHNEDAETWENLVEVVVLVRNGAGKIAEYCRVSKRQIEARRAKSAQPNAGPWKEWPLEMSLKTAVKYALNRGIISIQISPGVAHALAADSQDDAPLTPIQAEPLSLPAPSARGFGELETALEDPAEQKADPAPAQ